MIPAHAIQRRGHDLWAAFDSIELTRLLCDGLYDDLVRIRVVRAMSITDVVAFFDALFDDQNPDLTRREPSFLDILRELGDAEPLVIILDEARSAMPLAARDRTRSHDA